jgi:PAS domain S-box-containing protein
MSLSWRFMDWPVRAKMAALLVAASLLPLGIAAYVDTGEAHERLRSSLQDLLQARGDQIVRELDAFHRGYRLSADRIALFPDVKAYCAAGAAGASNPALVAEASGILAAYPAIDPNVRGAALLDRTGHVVIGTEAPLVGVDLSHQSHVRTAVRGIRVVSDVFVALPQVGEVPSIAYLAPVIGPDGQTVCVAALWVRAAALWRVVKASNALAGPNSFAVLFDQQGIRIAHTYSDEIVFHPGGPLDAATIDALVAERRFGTRTRALLEDIRSFPEQFDRARSAAPVASAFRGFAPVNQTWNYGVARRFEAVPWTVFYMVPEAAFDAQLARLTRAKAVLAAAIMAAAAAAGMLLSASILKPIRALLVSTKAIADGDLAARVPSRRTDEFGQLSESFNLMAERIQAQATGLQRSRDELEQRVQERTVDLETEVAERKRAEEAIRESQQLLQSIIDNSAAVIYVKDLEGRYLLVNRRYSELFHVSDEAIVGKSDHELFPKDMADAFRAMDQRVAAADAPVIEEEVAPHDDGPHTYVSVKCPLRDMHGKVHGVFGISTDITERKQAEVALRASEERTRLIVDTALDAVVTIDGAGVITGWSPQAERTFGWTRHEALGQELAETVIPQRYRDAHRRGLERYLATGEAMVLNKRIEMTALRRDGREFPVDLAITPIRTDATIEFGAFVRDITDRKLADSHLQAQLERLQLLDQITAAIGERQDLRSIYQVAIRSLEERLPVDFSCVCRYDAVDQTLMVIHVGAHSHALAMEIAMDEQSRIEIDRNGLSRCVRGELVYEPDIRAIEFPFPRRLARGGLCSLVVAPLQSESRVFGILVAARLQPQSFSSGDCEFLRQLSSHVALAAQQAQLHGALQQAYDDLRQTQQTVMQQERLRALGQMASGIAHDINNALSPVALYTENLLERESGLSERGRGYLVTIARAIDDVAATVARMREFYRPREPQLALVPVQLNPLVQQVVDLTRARWSDMPQQRGVVIQLETDLAPDLPAMLGVESEVREALINLVFNAVDAMPDGGVLTLRTHCAGSRERDIDATPRYAMVEVVDNGVGMDEDTQRRCLEPFFSTKGERGTGLGLAMVYGVTQRHGGDILIESTLGHGTAVRLSFPVSTAAAIASDAAPPPEAPTSRLRILLVDDDPLLLKSLCDTLELDGHVVVIANGGQAGIDTFRSARPPAEAFDVVITDLGMPYVDGRKVASAIKESDDATPVILLTGWGQRLVADGEVPAHVDRVLSKPPKLREVRAALAQLTPRAGAADSNSAKESP